MIDLASYTDVQLWSGFIITEVQLTREPIVDALGREAIAQTRCIGKNLRPFIRFGMSEQELSVTLYHEILEAATVASSHPPASVLDFNEADFERAGYAMHEKFGEASPENLNRMLQFYGFREQ